MTVLASFHIVRVSVPYLLSVTFCRQLYVRRFGCYTTIAAHDQLYIRIIIQYSDISCLAGVEESGGFLMFCGVARLSGGGGSGNPVIEMGDP